MGNLTKKFNKQACTQNHTKKRAHCTMDRLRSNQKTQKKGLST
jgi:hypothetical protein